MDVLITDGNLSPDDISGDDGRAIVASTRKNDLGVKIVGLSRDTVDGADVSIKKGYEYSDDLENLGETVTKL